MISSPEPLDPPELIRAFFAALELRQMERCEQLLTQLRSLASVLTTYEPWCDYLSGILTNERDRNWGEAEQIFSHLLQTDITLDLRGRVLLALGLTYQYQGRWADAIQTYQRSHSLFVELDRLVDQAKALKQVAISCHKGFMQGDFGEEVLSTAVDHCHQALELLRSFVAGQEDSTVLWLSGSIWNTLGTLNMNLGRLSLALENYQQDFAICRALQDEYGIGASLLNMGEIYQKMGTTEYTNAQDAYLQALAIFRVHQDPYLLVDTLADLGSLSADLSQATQALAYYRQAITVIEEMRSNITTDTARAGFFSTVADVYAQAVLLSIELKQEEEAFSLVERARARAFLDVWASGSRSLSSAQETHPLRLDEVQAALPSNALLLALFTTGVEEVRLNRAARRQKIHRHRFPSAKTLVFAITHDQLYLFEAGINPNDLHPGVFGKTLVHHLLRFELRHTLYTRLIAPIQPLLAGKRHLYVIPHGPYHAIPFQALAVSTDHLLSDMIPVLIYSPSATVLFGHTQAQHETPQLGCLTIGYNGAAPNALQYAEAEAMHIAQQLHGESWVSVTPKLQSLYAHAHQYRWLHISCHGHFHAETPLASGLQLAPDEILTAQDILQKLRLSCDLLTLSACESGVSRVHRGDELIGLIRACMIAGARWLIATLWQVDECSTFLLMEHFYQQVQRGQSFADALGQAQHYLRTLTRQQVSELLGRFATPVSLPTGNADDLVFADPYYWAPFCLFATTIAS